MEKQAKGKKATYSKPYMKSFSKAVEEKRGSSNNTKTPARFEKFKKDKEKENTPLTLNDRRVCFKCKGYGHVIKD